LKQTKPLCRLNNKSRMKGDFHVRFGESQRGRFPLATRLLANMELIEVKPGIVSEHSLAPILGVDMSGNGQLGIINNKNFISVNDDVAI